MLNCIKKCDRKVRYILPFAAYKCFDRRDGVMVRASTSQSVGLGFIPEVESYQNTLKTGIHSFPAWRLV